MTNLSDKIISVFLDKHVLTLKDSEISLALVAQGIPLYTEEVRRYAQSLSPALFQLSFNKDSSMTIQVDPRIDICGPFLAGRCHNSVKPCGKLHLCREFGHCTIQKCRFPHDFNHGENRKIIEQNNCQAINCQLLVQLIRLKLTKTRSTPFSIPHQPTTYHQELPKQDDINRQVDISYPSLKLASQCDMEIIEMILSTDGIRIENKLSECENEYFRRGTIQLGQINDVEKLLNSPIRRQENFDIKFKRTKQLIDRTSFKLKTSINNIQDKITEGRIRLYISVLVRENVTFTINDLSTMNEQIFLIQCDKELDFDKVRQQYESKRQLHNKDISLIQIYECDTVSIRYMDRNKTMQYEDIERIIPSSRENIFTFELTDQNCVEVEFLNAQAFKQWMSIVDRIKTKFQLLVTPVVNDMDESETIPNAAQSIPFNLNSPVINKPQGTTIKLRPDWTVVAAHPLFEQEFKDYIHEQLGGEIEINNDEVTYTGNLPRLPRAPTNEAILSNKTNNYMQKLKYSTFRDLKPYQLNILRAHSTNVAYNRIRRNDYLVVAKPPDMFLLKSKIFPKTNQHQQSDGVHPRMNLQSNDIYRSPSMSSLHPETIERPPSPPRVLPTAPASIFPVTTSEQMSMFSIKLFEDRLQQHLNETFNVKIIIERSTMNEKKKGEKSRIVLKVPGQPKDVENALEDLMNLFSLLRTRIFNDKTNGNWTKIEEATQIIQHHLLSIDLICTCQKISPTTVHINYFDLTNPQFGVDEQKIEDLINNQFTLATIPYDKQSTSTKFTKEWTNLEETIRQRDDYKKNICLYNESNAIYLFGLTKLVKEYRQAFEQLKNRHVPQACKINLSDKQLNYLTRVAKNDLNKLEKQYKADGCELTLVRLRQHGEFIAPPDMHSKIRESLEALAQIEERTFEIKDSAFEVLISKEPERLLSIVKFKCYLEKQVKTDRIYIPLPTAQTADPEDLVQQQPQAASTTNSASINIGNSTITIAIGDLTAQAVDMIVVCSTSEILRKEILAKAGSRVQAEYEVWEKSGQNIYATSNGRLPCKKIFFLPWGADRSEPTALKKSLSTFVSTAIKHAEKNGYQTIAFPSVGCGKLGFDPSIIAQHMIDETQLQLKSITSKIDVSFVLLSSQQNVYDEFVKYLNTLQKIPATTSKIPSTSRNNKNQALQIPYDVKTIQITLISANKDHLDKCKHDILELSRSSSYTTCLTDKHDMIDWSQTTIHQYYTYCLKQHVIPKFDFDKRTLELVGPKDAVNEAEKHFYELTTETFKQARIQAVSRNVIWAVEITPDSNTWEQYSYKLNGAIEDAHLKNLPHIDFINDKQERCRIVFKTMEEHHETDIRRIRRKQVDSLLPDEWEPSDQNCSRITLQSSSKEYQEVLKQFNKTMTNHYTQILKIERIQNVRWYKQYVAHRDEYQRRYGKLDERLLFHGCLGTAANQIVQECFNRSFAGINGVAYGCGVYFHSHAGYSHSYAKPGVSGERTMFLARVLIGKTCVGNQTMKVPPPGYDTTSDGRDIFVIYHDAGAYADHLITYK